MKWACRLCAVVRWLAVAVIVAMLAWAAFDLATPLLGPWSGP